MKQIDTAQLDITACQAQAAEYHARGFNCAQAVACTLAPAVGLDPQVAFTLTEGFGAGMGGMTETCGAISGAVAIMGFVMSDGLKNPTKRFKNEEHDDRRNARYVDNCPQLIVAP
ncbi:MAG: C-GCAxxG-C-C family protein [Collinsella sp.]